jgi:hypothetical protein
VRPASGAHGGIISSVSERRGVSRAEAGGEQPVDDDRGEVDAELARKRRAEVE